MAGKGYDPLELLQHIDPALLDYQEWENVGAILKDAGLDVDVWDSWSRSDLERYKTGECARKWRTIRGSANPVTVGTLYEYATRQGWEPDRGHVIGWDDMISDDGDYRVVDPAWVDPHPGMPTAPAGNGAMELREYLELLFRPEEYVGYTMESSYDEDRDKFHPSGSGAYTRTAGELIDLIDKYRDREDALGWVLGDYDTQAGAWIRFNPLDGKGVGDENVTEYRYALVESDAVSIEKQYSLITTLELPVAVLIHSGRKSLHAIVRVDAKSLTEYKAKIKYLYEVCDANGLTVDQNNKNPSRLSRMPGIERGEGRQYIVARNLGKPSWQEWVDYIEDLRDDLADIQVYSEAFKNPLPLAPELIQGVLRQGHKMLLSGPSKAGKSFALIELAIAIAEGDSWLLHKCARGRVLYINLEVDEASCNNRIAEVYSKMGYLKPSDGMLDVWHLRGAALPLDKLVPKLIRRAKDKQYKAIILDPIYKVLTGDENSASEMAEFCNQFDKVCKQLGASVIYCHHHSKGQQSGKAAMDRASGSGVFARDPDALVDFLQMKVPEENLIAPQATGWKISYALREFPPPKEDYFWFAYPVHLPDEENVITRAVPDTGDQKPDKSTIKETRLMQFDLVYADLFENNGGNVTLQDLAKGLQADNKGNPPTERTVRSYIETELRDQYYIKNGNVFPLVKKKS